MENQHYPYALPPLPFAYDAMEPYIDAETMRLHHDEHFARYIENLNKALASYPLYHNKSLLWLLENSGALPEEIRGEVRGNAGGVINHDQYFKQMKNGGKGEPQGPLAEAMNAAFGSFENFKEQFSQSARELFGSGYTFLVMSTRPDTFGSLSLLNLINQDVPPRTSWYPILLIDVWEHAYYLKYNHERNRYIDAWFNIINWDWVEQNYERAKAASHL